MSYPNYWRKAAGLLLVPLALSAFEAQADTTPLVISPDDASGIWGATYTGTDENGNIFGFSMENIDIEWYFEIQQAYDDNGNQMYDPSGEPILKYVPRDGAYCFTALTGLSTSSSSITLPSSIQAEIQLSDEQIERVNNSYWGTLIDESPYAIDVYPQGLRFEVDATGETSFPNSPNLTEIVVNHAVYDCVWSGDDFGKVINYRFNVIPQELRNSSKTTINIILPDNIYFGSLNELKEHSEGNFAFKSTSPRTPVNINVDVPGNLAENLAANVANFEDVRWLIVTGCPNEDDMRMFRRLPHLEVLDLSGADIKTVVGCNNLDYLSEVVLPECIEKISDNAFYNCQMLSTINFPDGLKEIGNNSFEKCRSLYDITLPASVYSIGNSAFRSSSITSINLESITMMQEYAFAYCNNLNYVDLSSLKLIPNHAFERCGLTDVKFSDNLIRIDYFAFAYNHINQIRIPDSVCAMDNYEHFYANGEIDLVELGANMPDLPNGSFVGTHPKTIISHILFPQNYTGFEDYSLNNTVLYVPALTLNEYYVSDAWAPAKDIREMDGDLDQIFVDRAFTLKRDKGLAEKADIYNYATRKWVNEYGDVYDNEYRFGHLTIDRKTDLDLANYFHKANMSTSSWWNGYSANYNGSTLITNSNAKADNVEVSLTLNKDNWHFVSFPFDVNVKDIKVEDDALWVVRKYSGADRANLTGNTWQNMTDNDVLKAGEGYIFHCTKENDDWIDFTFKPATDGNAMFANDVVTYTLNEYASEFAHNASWNLRGNSFPAYLHIEGVEFDAPITVWEGNTYAAYTAIDDDYVFRPFQAFFVQRQDIEGGDAITLNPSYRNHTTDFSSYTARRAPRAEVSGRALFNVFLSNEVGKDRARVVVNEEASEAYESSRDASKFMSTDAKMPQIYVMNNGEKMAIDELPLGNGEFILGTRFGASGEHTIALETRNAAGFTATLIDTATGITTDLMDSAYTFDAKSGSDDSRFILLIGGDVQTGIEAAAAEGIKVAAEGNVITVSAPEAIEIVIVNAEGMTVATAEAADFTTTLANGIYVVKAGNHTFKVNI